MPFFIVCIKEGVSHQPWQKRMQTSGNYTTGI